MRTVFNDFYGALGHRVFSSPSADWVEIQRGALLSIPYHRLINPPDEELEDLLGESGALVLRYPTDAANYGFDSTLQFCRCDGYSLEQLRSSVRNQVRKGEKSCSVRRVAVEELAEAGGALNQMTCRRQHRHDPKEDAAYWARLCRAVADTPAAVVWGAFHNDRLAAYLIALETPTTVEFIMHNSDTALLPLCPNNILVYRATRWYLAERTPPLPVCYGLGSLEDTASLEHFKTEMGYLLEPIKQRIYFRRRIAWLINPYSLAVARRLTGWWFPESYFFRKSLGLMQRYLSQH